jgi:hypothetical protein
MYFVVLYTVLKIKTFTVLLPVFAVITIKASCKNCVNNNRASQLVYINFEMDLYHKI